MKRKILMILIVLVIGIFTTINTKTYELINPATLRYEDMVKFDVADSYDKTKGKYGEITYNYTFTNTGDTSLYFNDTLFRSSLFPKKEIDWEKHWENHEKLIYPSLTKTNKYTITEEDIKKGFVTNNVEYCLEVAYLLKSNTLIDDMKFEYAISNFIGNGSEEFQNFVRDPSIQNFCKYVIKSGYDGTYEECLKDENVKMELEFFKIVRDPSIQNFCKCGIKFGGYDGTYEECLKDENVKMELESFKEEIENKKKEAEEYAEEYINKNYACGQKSITTKIDKLVEDKKDNVQVVNVPPTSLDTNKVIFWIALLVTAICSFALYITIKGKKKEI